jgi:hypothetical protein
MIIRLLLDGLLSLGRPPASASLRLPRRTAPAGRRRAPDPPDYRGRPDLMLVTGAMSAPPSSPPRTVRRRPAGLQPPGGPWAA